MAGPDYNVNGAAVPIPLYRVFQRDAYNGGSWEFQSNVEVLQVIEEAGAVTKIVLHYKTGQIQREGLTGYVQVEPAEWGNTYVMVEVYGANNDGSPNLGTVLARWIGIVTPDEREALGYLQGAGFAYDQTMLALGLETLLDESIVYGSYVSSLPVQGNGRDPIAIRIDTPIAFNAPRNGPYRWSKNRSKDGLAKKFDPRLSNPNVNIESPDQNFTGDKKVPVFDLAGTDTKTWSIADILSYLLVFYGPSFGDVGFRIRTLDAGDNDLIKALQGFEVTNFTPERMSLLQCLNSLIRPERGLGWAIDYDDDARGGNRGPTIVIYSISAQDLSQGSWSLPQATNKQQLDVTNRRDVRWQIRRDPLEEYGTVEVRGAPTLSCFSLSQPDGSLDKGWIDKEETAYNSPPDIGTDNADFGLEQRKADYRARSRVWTEYVLKKDWDFKAKNGENSGTAKLVNPRVDDNAEIPSQEMAGSRSLFDKRFESFIPIEVERNAPNGTDGQPQTLDDAIAPQYQSALCVYKDPDGKWIDLMHHKHPNGLHASQFHALNDRPGVKIRCEPNHALAGSEHPPGDLAVYPTDWKKVIVTVAMRLERRVSVVNVFDATITRLLVIDIDDAEFWFINPNTVTGVDTLRALKRQGNERKIVRDDRDRLRRTLSLATAWYGQRRQPIALQFTSLQFQLGSGNNAVDLKLGTFITRLVDGVESPDCNCVITRRRYDFTSNSTQIDMGFSMRPDFAALA